MAGRLSTQVQTAKLSTRMPDEDDFFLKNIKAKGFCHVSLTTTPLIAQQNKQKNNMPKDCISLDALQQRMTTTLAAYIKTRQNQAFATFLIAQLIVEQPDLSLVEQELISVWNCLAQNKSKEKIVEVYSNFLNEVYDSKHISFFVMAHRTIDQVVNGDASSAASIQRLLVQVDKVVDVVQTVFKSAITLSIFETVQEIPQSTL